MLKSLELFGFKSFADRTRFDFSRGITCVVGPNGSGKSNVVDAMKWILGDQSAKSLRGKEMTDVIFNGSSGRKGSAFAEATLTFDNSGRMLPIEADEVTVGRRLWRNGDSEYLINGATARLKDIRDAFMGTGAGASAYSIIEQGRVGQILQANASARRLVFEEAAGISRFKSRKVESLRKLDRVSQNLIRLQDIVDQLESQLNSTRSQAVKAAKYREVSVELKSLWLGLAADDHRWYSAQLETVDERLDAARGELEKLNAEQAEIDGRLASFDGELSTLDNDLREVERQVAATREAIVSQETTIRHETSRMRETESECARVRRQQSGTQSRLAELSATLDRTIRELNSFDTDYQSQQDRVRTLGERIDQLAADFSRNRGEIDVQQSHRSKKSDEASGLRQQIALLEAQLDSFAEVRDRTSEQQLKLAREIDQSEAEVERCRKALTAAVNESTEQNAATQTIKARRSELVATQEATRGQVVELRERRSASQARLTVLEDLEERQEGVGIGVREILTRARTSTLSPWNQVVGTVADLLDVDLENAALLEVALGSRAQIVVLTQLDDFIGYLTRSKVRIDGRVGFIGIHESGMRVVHPGQTSAHDMQVAADRSESADVDNKDSDQTVDAVDLSGDRDVVCRADTLLSATCEHRTLATRLLGTTWVVMDLDAARRLADQHPEGLRFVTLQGELLEPDGTVYLGSVRGETAVLSRKSELRRLQNELIRLDQSVVSSEKQIAGLDQQIAAVDQELVHAGSRREEASARLTTLRAEFEAQQQVLSRLIEHRTSITGEEAEAEAKAAELQTRLTSRFNELSEVEEAQQLAQDEVARLETSLIEIEQERNRLVQEQTEEKLRLARKSERRETLQSDERRLTDELTAQQERADELDARRDEQEQRLRELTLSVLNAGAELAELMIAGEQTSEVVSRLRGDKEHQRRERTRLAESENRIRQQRRSVADREHQIEMETREMRHNLASCGERIEEEYGLTMDDVLASNASAFRDYLVGQGLLNVETDDAESSAADVDDEEEDAAVDGQSVDPDTEDEDWIDEEFEDDAEYDEDEEDFEEDDSGDEEEWDEEQSEEWSEDESDEVAEDEDDDSANFEPDDENQSGDVAADDGRPLVLCEIEGVKYEDVRAEIEEEVNRLRRKLKSMGGVNTESLKDLDELEDKFNHFRSQLDDLLEAKSTLEDIIRRINNESRRLFLESFEMIRVEFRELFRKLFGGGDGDIILEDPDDVLDCGIDIVARPPGKELRSITLLSGGEKTMTAVALLLAIFKSRPSPFCILDEVDAALDDGNVERYAGVIYEFRDATQFIMITHRKRTMTVADVLYGVTMEQSGVSKRLVVKFDEVGDDGEIKATGGDTAQAA